MWRNESAKSIEQDTFVLKWCKEEEMGGQNSRVLWNVIIIVSISNTFLIGSPVISPLEVYCEI